MDFDLNEEQRAFREAVTGFARRHLADGALARAREPGYPWDVARLMAEQGLLGITVAEADGGQTDIFLHGKHYDIFWNVVPETPAEGNRLLRVIVRWPNVGKVKRVTLDYVGNETGI